MPGLIASSASGSRLDGKRLHFATRQPHLRARCNSAGVDALGVQGTDPRVPALLDVLVPEGRPDRRVLSAHGLLLSDGGGHRDGKDPIFAVDSGLVEEAARCHGSSTVWSPR